MYKSCMIFWAKMKCPKFEPVFPQQTSARTTNGPAPPPQFWRLGVMAMDLARQGGYIQWLGGFRSHWGTYTPY